MGFFESREEFVDCPFKFVNFLLCISHVVRRWNRMVDGWRVKRSFGDSSACDVDCGGRILCGLCCGCEK